MLRRTRTASRSIGATSSSSQFHQVNVWAIVAARARFLRERLWPRAADPLGLRGQPADRRSARRLRRERLLRPRTASRCSSTTSIAARSASIPAFDRHHQSRVRPRRARWHPSALHRGRSLPETAAFHEFMGDLTAILIALPQQRVSASGSSPKPAAISVSDSALSQRRRAVRQARAGQAVPSQRA